MKQIRLLKCIDKLLRDELDYYEQWVDLKENKIGEG